VIPVGYTLRFLAWPIGAWLLGIETSALVAYLWFEYIVSADVIAAVALLPWTALKLVTPGTGLGAFITLVAVVLLTSYSRGTRLGEPSDPELSPDASPVGRINQEHRKLANVFRAFTRAQKRNRLDHLMRPRPVGFVGFSLFLTLLQFPFAVGDWMLGKFWVHVRPHLRRPHLPSRPGSDDAFGDGGGAGAGPEPPPFDATAPSDSPEYDAQYSSARRGGGGS
jgi:hypothetical protein